MILFYCIGIIFSLTANGVHTHTVIIVHTKGASTLGLDVTCCLCIACIEGSSVYGR